MIHVSSWSCTEALFEESKSLLSQNNFLMLYGPFLREKTQTSESNLDFDKSLKLKNPNWGLRKLEDVTEIASLNGFRQDEIFEMPANNLSVIYSYKKNNS